MSKNKRQGIILGVISVLVVGLGAACVSKLVMGGLRVYKASTPTADLFLTALERNDIAAAQRLSTDDLPRDVLADTLKQIQTRHGKLLRHSQPEGFYINVRNSTTFTTLTFAEHAQNSDVVLQITVVGTDSGPRVAGLHYAL